MVPTYNEKSSELIPTGGLKGSKADQLYQYPAGCTCLFHFRIWI